jgi:hypothetical protein
MTEVRSEIRRTDALTKPNIQFPYHTFRLSHYINSSYDFLFSPAFRFPSVLFAAFLPFFLYWFPPCVCHPSFTSFSPEPLSIIMQSTDYQRITPLFIKPTSKLEKDAFTKLADRLFSLSDCPSDQRKNAPKYLRIGLLSSGLESCKFSDMASVCTSGF